MAFLRAPLPGLSGFGGIFWVRRFGASGAGFRVKP